MFILKKFLGDKFDRVNNIIDAYNNTQNNYINMEACCSYPFPTVLDAQCYPMHTLPTEGTVGNRYFPLFSSMEDIDYYTEELVLKLLNAHSSEYGVCNQPHSGTQANQIVYNAILKEGDCILSLDPKSGGHISHNKFTRNIKVVNYGLDSANIINYNQIEELAVCHKPKLIIIGASSYPNDIDYKKIANIAHKNGALLMIDSCHTILYIMAGLYTNPFPEVDFMTFSLEKVLRGPQGGIVVYRKNFYEHINYAVFPLTQGGPIQTMQFAKLLCFLELSHLDITDYAKKVQKNAEIIGQSLIYNGIHNFAKDYRTHIILIDVTPFSLTGNTAEQLFYDHHILVNKNQIPKDNRLPHIASGIRLGTTCITNLEYTETDTAILGKYISNLLLNKRENINILQNLIDTYHKNINISN